MQRFGDTLRPDKNEIGAAELLATVNGKIKETTKAKTKEQESARKKYEETLATINNRYKKELSENEPIKVALKSIYSWKSMPVAWIQNEIDGYSTYSN